MRGESSPASVPLLPHSAVKDPSWILSIGREEGGLYWEGEYGVEEEGALAVCTPLTCPCLCSTALEDSTSSVVTAIPMTINMRYTVREIKIIPQYHDVTEGRVAGGQKTKLSV